MTADQRGSDEHENHPQIPATIEHRALTALVPRVVTATLLILVVATFAFNNNATGSVNKSLYIAVLIIAAAITVVFVRFSRSLRVDVVLAVAASLGLLWGIWTIERPQLLNFGYWEGFGFDVTLATVALLLLVGATWPPRRLTVLLRIVLGMVVIAVCLFDALGAVRTIDYMPAVNNNLNEINDLLGPAAGNVPDSSFIPQYTALYGWVLEPLKGVLSPLNLVSVIAIMLTGLGFVTVALAVWTAKRVLADKGWILALALVVPITYVTSHVTGDISSIGSLFQELAIRLLSGFLIAAVGLKDLVLMYRGILRVRRLVAVGALCGLIAWNSQDFGVAAMATYGLMVLVVPTSSVRWRALGSWLLGLVIGLAVYPLFLLAIGSPLNLSFVGAFAKLAESGMGSAPIQVPGPVLVVVPIIISSTATGWALIAARRRQRTSDDVLLNRAAIALAFVGTWSTVGLAYYMNRGYAAGQLQTMLLPCGVCVACLASIALHTKEFARARDARRNPTAWSGLYGKVTLFPVGIFACLCLASALLAPEPILASTELVHPPAGGGFTTYDLPQVVAAVDRARTYTAGRPGSLTYLGESFNYVALALHVPSGTDLFPYALSPASDRSVIQIECQYLDDHHSRWLVLSSNAVAAFGTGACGLYEPVSLHGLGYGQLQELK